MRFARTFVLAFLSFLAVTLSLTPFALAQVPDPVTTAIAPTPGVGHHYIGIGAETVNPADGSICFELPIQTPPGRELSFPFGIHFCNTETFSVTNNAGSLFWELPPAPPFGLNGWSYALPGVTGVVAQTDAVPDPSGQGTDYCLGLSNLVFRSFEGVESFGGGTLNQWPYTPPPANISNALPCWANMTAPVVLSSENGALANNPGPLNQQTAASFSITDRSGTTYQFPSFSAPFWNGSPVPWGLLAESITDRNGNRIGLNGGGNTGTTFGSGNYVDTLGRNIVSWTGIGSSSGDTLTISGLSGNITVRWTTITITLPKVSQPITTTPSCNFNDVSSSLQVHTVSEIDLPNGQKYTFSTAVHTMNCNKLIFPGTATSVTSGGPIPSHRLRCRVSPPRHLTHRAAPSLATRATRPPP